jgi:uncharacterized protein YecE (DUF72 family)
MSVQLSAFIDPPPLPSLRGTPEPARVGNIRLGTASWTERTLLDSGAFYPPSVRTPEQRLRYYAHHFPVVEVDASYYALPSVRNAHAWVERTPDDFIFGIKAYAALTTHPFEPQRLDKDLRAELPGEMARQPRLYPRELPEAILEAIWERFRAALAPLQAAGKLGYVLFQMPPWFRPTRESHEYLDALQGRLAGLPVAVEFRQALWMAEERRARTLDFLRTRGFSYVSVDEPQGTPASVPPIAEVTSAAMAVVRFHGRRRETWTRPGVGTTERFRYLYTRDELAEWTPRLHALARRTRNVYAVTNNCHRESAVQNAKDLAVLLSEG